MILSKVIGRRIFTIQRRISLLCLWQFLTKVTASHKIFILCCVFVDLHPPIFIKLKKRHPGDVTSQWWDDTPNLSQGDIGNLGFQAIQLNLVATSRPSACQVISPAIHWAIGAITTIIAPKPQSLMCFDWDSEPIQHGTNWTLDWFKIPITIDQLVWV